MKFFDKIFCLFCSVFYRMALVRLCGYSNLIQAIPMFIWSLFFGSFLDRQTGVTRMIFAWINILGLITTVFYLVNIFNFLIGM